MKLNSEVTYSSAFKNIILALGLAAAKDPAENKTLDTVEKDGVKYTKIPTPLGARYIHLSKDSDHGTKIFMKEKPELKARTFALGSKREFASMLADSKDSLKQAIKEAINDSNDTNRGYWLRYKLQSILGNKVAAGAELFRFLLGDALAYFPRAKGISSVFDRETAIKALQKLFELFPKRRGERDPLTYLKELKPDNLKALIAVRDRDENQTVKEIYEKYATNDPEKTKKRLEAELAKEKFDRDGSLKLHEIHHYLAEMHSRLGNQAEAFKAMLAAYKAAAELDSSDLDSFMKQHFNKTQRIKFWQENKKELEEAGLATKCYQKLKELGEDTQEEYIDALFLDIERADSSNKLGKIAFEFNNLANADGTIAALKKMASLAKAGNLDKYYAARVDYKLMGLFHSNALHEEALDFAQECYRLVGVREYNDSSFWPERIIKLAIKTGKIEQAAESFRKTGNKDKVYLVKLYSEAKQFDKALEAAQALLKNNYMVEKRGAVLLEWIAGILSEQGKAEKSKRVSEFAKEIRSQSKR